MISADPTTAPDSVKDCQAFQLVWRGVAFHAVYPIHSLSVVCRDRAFVGFWGFVVSLLWPYCPNTVGVLSCL